MVFNDIVIVINALIARLLHLLKSMFVTKKVSAKEQKRRNDTNPEGLKAKAESGVVINSMRYKE